MVSDAKAEAEAARGAAAEARASAAAASRGGQEGTAAAVANMEGALTRLSEHCRKKDEELAALRRTVQSECDERVRLLATVQALQAHNGAAPPPPPASAPAMAPGDVPKMAPFDRKQDPVRAAWPPAVQGPTGAARKAGRRGGR